MNEESNNIKKYWNKKKREKYVKHLYKKLQREGQLERDVDRLVRNDRIAWGSSMIACKDADAMVTGNIRHYAASIEKLKKVVDARPNEEIFGMTMIVSKGKTILVADTNVTELPSAERLVNISKSCVRIARLFGFEPKVALLGGEDGLKHIREIIQKAPIFLKEKGWLILENHFDQGEKVKQLFIKNKFTSIEIVKDLSGIGRFTIGRYK